MPLKIHARRQPCRWEIRNPSACKMKYTNTPVVRQQCIICEPRSRTKVKLPAPLNPAMQYRTAPGRDLAMNRQQTWTNLSPWLPLGEAAQCYRQIPYSLMKMTLPPEKSQKNMDLINHMTQSSSNYECILVSYKGTTIFTFFQACVLKLSVLAHWSLWCAAMK